jgi:hypothetical protein
VPEFDVESEIYESLYGVPRRERGQAGPDQGPIVIVDGALSAAHGEIDPASAVPPSLRGAPSLRLADRLADGLAVATAALRSRPAPAVITAALVVVPVLALLLAAAGRSGAARMHLTSPASQSAAPALAATVHPAAPPRRVAAPAASASAGATQTADAAGVDNPTSGSQRFSNLHPRARHTSTTHRPQRVVTQPPPTPPPIREPAAHERPAPKRPGTTTPGSGKGTPPGHGVGDPSVTGGQPAPTD